MEAEVINDYFDRYPDHNELFENGGKIFLSKSGAESFGATVTVTHTRQVAEMSVVSDDDDDQGNDDQGNDQGNDAPKDYRAMKYPQLVAECNALGIAPTDNKKDTLIAALEAAQ